MTAVINTKNVMNPMGTWSNTTTYKAEAIYGGFANSPLTISCPVVKGPDGLLYCANGYNKNTGAELQPTLGTAPASDAAWTPLTAGDGSGSVSTVSVVSANGLAGTVANPTTTPAITLSTSINGLLRGNGTAISAASTLGSGADVALTGAAVSWTPTISVASPGDLNIVYSQQAGSYRRIGDMGYLSFYLAATVTYATATGTFNIIGLPSFAAADEATCTMDVFVKSTTVYTAGFTSFVGYMDGTGSTIQIMPQSTNPAENPSSIGIMDITDFNSGELFKFRGMLIFPVA